MRVLTNSQKDIGKVFFLIGLALAIFYPIFYAEYAYTDEIVQLWFYPNDKNYHMFLPQGRYITEKLFQWLFGSAHTIKEISYIRLFSLGGWIISIPIWYYIIKRIVIKEKLPEILAFFSTLYLICTPQFSIYVSWASCLELFLANTSGLLSGYFLYSSISDNEKFKTPVKGIVLAVLFGVISLFTYQNGFGCFLIPFLVHLIAKPQSLKTIFIGIGIYLFIYVIYYFLFKYNLRLNNIEASSRTNLSINIVNKLKFMYSRPLSSAFHFTYLFNEKSLAGYMVYAVILGGWVMVSFYRLRFLPFVKRFQYLAIVFLFFGLMYIPSLAIKENYSSNRTLLALKMAVFFLVVELVISHIKKNKSRLVVVTIISALFVINCWFNFNKQFLSPIRQEYAKLRSFIETNYRPDIDTFYFIRPEEDFFVREFGITRSWDEFGVPSSFFDWVPEFLVKQIVFEKTGNRELAGKLVIKHWLGKESFLSSGEKPSNNSLLINAEEIIVAKPYRAADKFKKSL